MVRINSHAYNIHVDLFPQRHICRLCHKHILFPDSRLRIYSMDQRHTPRQKVIRHKNKAIADQTHSPQAIAVMLRYIFASVDSVILRATISYRQHSACSRCLHHGIEHCGYVDACPQVYRTVDSMDSRRRRMCSALLVQKHLSVRHTLRSIYNRGFQGLPQLETPHAKPPINTTGRLTQEALRSKNPKYGICHNGSIYKNIYISAMMPVSPDFRESETDSNIPDENMAHI